LESWATPYLEQTQLALLGGCLDGSLESLKQQTSMLQNQENNTQNTKYFDRNIFFFILLFTFSNNP